MAAPHSSHHAHHRPLLPDLRDWVESGLPHFPMSALPLLRAWSGETIPIEIAEEEGAFTVRAELPGLDPDRDIQLSARDDTLSIRAERPEDDKEAHRSEFRYGTLQRAVRLPFTIPEKDITADYRCGILTVHIPVPAQATPPTQLISIEHRHD